MPIIGRRNEHVAPPESRQRAKREKREKREKNLDLASPMLLPLEAVFLSNPLDPLR
jgi:hypothetical protein